MKKVLILLAILAVTSVVAVDAPSLMNYQGVLRDAAGNPVSGDHDIVFRFFDADTAGDELLIDEHTLDASTPVTVSGGLFNVALGGGKVSAGSAPGSFTNLAEMFANRTEVWLQIEVNGEVLDPRVQILASAYAMNSTRAELAANSAALDGNSSAAFLRANADDTATGVVTFEGAPTGTGPTEGSVVINPASAGSLTTLFGVAVNGTEKMSVDADGFLTALGGGYFQDTGAFAYVGDGSYGVVAYGDSAGGYFRDSDSDGLTVAGDGDFGVSGYGNTAGGRFEDWNGSGVGYAGIGNMGIQGKGTEAGGFFWDDDSSGYSYVGYGDLGIRAFGSTAGGFFGDLGGSGTGYVGYGDYGMQGFGNTAGAYFKDGNNTGYGYVGVGDDGVRGYGNLRGGYFKDLNGSGYAEVGRDDYGIKAYGDAAGGYFSDPNASGYGYAGIGNTGLAGYGSFSGAYFEDTSSLVYLTTAYSGSSTIGNGTKNFIQNHPHEQDRVIVYSALEGDEAATYTRGSARLENGQARIELSQTFQWVTNPDIGLTAQLTPRGRSAELYVESLSTTTLVVGGSPEADVAFDYVVFGLRLGFEDVSVVREKEIEAYLPSLAEDREMLSRNPSFESFTALDRFKRMESDVSGIDRDAIDLSRSRLLIASITNENPVTQGPGSIHVAEQDEPIVLVDPSGSPVQEDTAATIPHAASLAHPAVGVTTTDSVAGVNHGDSRAVRSNDLTGLFAVSEDVEPGDVLAIDPERPGFMQRASEMADPRIVGVVAEDAVLTTAEASVALAGMVRCKVDAGYGSIRPGDLLSSSPTAGHAMRAIEALPGTILGKAIEPLDAGTGEIRILLMPR